MIKENFQMETTHEICTGTLRWEQQEVVDKFLQAEEQGLEFYRLHVVGAKLLLVVKLFLE